MIDLLEYLTGLAPTGETALIVRQKPVMRDGEQVTHRDGTPKFTWPAFLPSHRRKDGESWFINTGCFIAERFTDGKPSASAANCEYVLFMMLDDIGTKSKEPPVSPTWVVETSPGNFQWGYAFSEQPTKGEFVAAITAIAEAGYTDPGATNAVRNCRLPGSPNLKPGKDGFLARLVAFHPGREYTLADICAGLGVTPGPAENASIQGIKLRDTGTDSVLRWLSDQGLVLSQVNAEGWCGVVCPNHAEHTDGQIEARYSPINRAFCCYHAHCDHLDSNAFLAWVSEQNGPSVQPGFREELVAERMAKVAEAIQPTREFPDVAAEVVAEVDRKELGRLTKREWFTRFAYVVEDGTYFDMIDRCEMTRSAFNAVFRHVDCKSIHTNRQIEPSVCFDENRQAAGGRVLRGVTYAAGESVLVARDGDVYGNRWVDARPDLSGVASGAGVTPWLDHAKLLIPDDVEREHVLDVMAYKLQHPEVKINHAILHGGDEGCGKDTLWYPFIWSVCGPGLRNRGLVDADGINSRWGYALESEILILNELKEPEAKERRALSNKLKPIIAAPPDTLTIERKGLHPYDMVNRLFVLAFTNDPVPLSLPSQDRRWFCIWSHAPKMAKADAAALWKWYKGGGLQAVGRWLADRDVSAFNPKAMPPWTDYRTRLIETGRSMAESYVIEQVLQPSREFAAGVIASPFHKLCSALQQGAPGGVKIPQAALLHGLKEAGWIDLGAVKSTEFQTKKNLWARPDMVKSYNKSDLRRMVEHAAGPGLTVVKS